MKDIKRKEVWLTQPEINRLQSLADKRDWSLKQYMEWILVRQSLKATDILPTTKTKHQ